MASEYSPEDKMNEYLLARIVALESIVMLLWNDHPNRGDIKASAKTIFDAEAANDLESLSADVLVDIRARANQAVFERVFTELLSESAQAELRTLQERGGK